MPVYYNIKARRHLAQLLTQNSIESIDSMNRELDLILSEYNEDVEIHPLIQKNFYKKLSETLSELYNKKIYKHKSFWGKILYFIGWLPTEELNLLKKTREIKQCYNKIPTALDSLSFGKSVALSLIPNNVDDFLIEEGGSKNKIRYLSHRTLNTVSQVPKALEGNFQCIAFSDYKTDLERYATTLESNQDTKISKWAHIFDQLTYCVEDEKERLYHANRVVTLNSWGENNTAAAYQEEFIQNIVFNTLDLIVNLPLGEKAILTHGFTSKEGGHATLLEVEKVDANRVVFRYIDTGGSIICLASPLGLWDSVWTGFNKIPIIATKPIEIDRLTTTNFNFIEQLVRSREVVAPDIKTAYKTIINPFKYLQKEKLLTDDKKVLRLQTMGSCAQSCIDAWVETQLDEYELNQFYMCRQKIALDEIEALLASNSLSSEERESCKCMRIAAKFQLELIKNKVRRDEAQAIEMLHSAREANAASKPSGAKKIDDIEKYCEGKLDPKRIESVVPEIRVHTVQTKREFVNIISLGFFGTQDRVLLDEKQRDENKLAKALLAKKILDCRKLLKKYDLQVAKLGVFSEPEQEKISSLVQLREKNPYAVINYKNLTP